jgi:hypothetical protein
LHIDGRRWHPALGLGLGLVTLCLCYVAFFLGLARCRAENNPHHPATCTPSDNHPGVFGFVAAFLSLAIFLFSLTALPPKVLVVLAGLVIAAYVAWGLSVWVT